MKKWLIPVIIIAVIVLGGYSWGKGFNNTAVELKESATKAWGDVESSYQRRNDLIGNLVKTVQGGNIRLVFFYNEARGNVCHEKCYISWLGHVGCDWKVGHWKDGIFETTYTKK